MSSQLTSVYYTPIPRFSQLGPSRHDLPPAGFCQGALVSLMCAGSQYCVPKVGLWIGGGDCGGYWVLDCGNGGTAPPTGGGWRWP